MGTIPARFGLRCLSVLIYLVVAIAAAERHAAPSVDSADSQLSGSAGVSALIGPRTDHGPLNFHQSRVVLIVLDGVRTEEFFRGSVLMGARRARPAAELMPFVYGRLIRDEGALVLGNRFGTGGRRHLCTVNNRDYISLPGYADLLGAVRQSNVRSNHFRGRVAYPTVVDRLLDRGLAPDEVAVFSSWEHIRNVVARSDHPGLHLESGRESGESRPPWGDARYDADLMQSIETFLDRRGDRLRFLFVAFNDSDEWAHQRKYRKYIKAIEDQDDYVRRIYENLEARPAFRGRTTYIVTTDHGRGAGRHWAHHGHYAGSQFIWAVVHSPRPHFVSRPEHFTWQRQLYFNCSHTSIGSFLYRLLNTSSARTIEIGKQSGW